MSPFGGGGVLSTHLTSIVLWSLLPQLLTSFVLKGCYSILPQIQPRLPPNATSEDIIRENGRAQNHHRLARIGLIVTYLIYTLYSVYSEQTSFASRNFYTLLGLTRDQVEAQGPQFVKSHFRRLARTLHPDKVGKDGEALFIAIKQAALVLENETGLRWAYDRFGSDVLKWQPKPITQREFLVRGAQATTAFYVVAIGSILLISFFRKNEKAQNYWRYLLLLFTFSLEFHLIFRTSMGSSFSHPFLSLLLPNRLPYQQIELLRQLFISLSMAISHLAPLISTSSMLEASLSESLSFNERLALQTEKDLEALKPALHHLMQLTRVLETEARMNRLTELRPLVGSEMTDEQLDGVLGDVASKAEAMIRKLKLKMGEGTKEAWQEAARKGLEMELKERGSNTLNGQHIVKTPSKTAESNLNGSSSSIKSPTSQLTQRIPKSMDPSSGDGEEDEANIIARARLLSPPPEA